MKTNEFISALGEAEIVAAIDAAEQRTSAEIRVCISEDAVNDPLAEARKQFTQLGMAETRLRNGVLIFAAPKTQCYSVLGDQGIHARCGPAFWESVVAAMEPDLRAGHFHDAIVLAVRQVGELLAREFPHEPGDRNELPNQIARAGGADESKP